MLPASIEAEETVQLADGVPEKDNVMPSCVHAIVQVDPLMVIEHDAFGVDWPSHKHPDSPTLVRLQHAGDELPEHPTGTTKAKATRTHRARMRERCHSGPAQANAELALGV
jgi:hypothetical protein